MRNPRAVRHAAAVLGAGALTLGATACSVDDTVFSTSSDGESESRAAAVSVPPDAAQFRSSALGPDRLNPRLPEDDPMAYVDPVLLGEDGKLPEGMSVTEAQALQVLDKLADQLDNTKFELTDVAAVHAYLTGDRDRTDYDGWNRAYRRYFANIDLETGGSMFTESVEPSASTSTTTPSAAARPAAATSATTATTEPSASTSAGPTTTSQGPYPVQDNRTRPTVTSVGVASLPTAGWLIQIEIEAFRGDD
jgi:enamine deaminase RidA (YjgF/YER057c/UK114 family)